MADIDARENAGNVAKSNLYRRAAIPVDQALSAVRSVGVLVFLTSTLNHDQLSSAIILFTAAQMLGALTNAGAGETALLSPRDWLLAGGGAFACKVIAFCTLITAAAVTVGSWLIDIPTNTAAFIVFISAAACWHDAFRAINIRYGRPGRSLLRNTILTGVAWLGAFLHGPLAPLALMVTGLIAVLATAQRRLTDKNLFAAHWSPRRAAATGISDAAIAYASIHGTLLIAATAGAASVTGLRFAQTCVGPISVLANAARISVTSVLSMRGYATSRSLLITTLVCALSGAGYVVALSSFPDPWLTYALGVDWAKVESFLVPVGAQAIILIASAVASANLRVAGRFGATTAARLTSAFLSLTCFGGLIHFGWESSQAAWGLLSGPLFLLPFWVFGLRRLQEG